jgi:hypothetical protein
MPNAKVKLNLRAQNVPEKVAFARRLAENLKSNTDFPSPSPNLAEVTASADTLEGAYNAAVTARQAAQAATATQDVAEQKLDGLLTRLGSHIEDAADGDEAKIRKAGFDVRADRAAVGALPSPTDLSATTGDKEGAIDLAWNRIAGAKSYVVEMTTDAAAATGWKSAGVCTKSSNTVTGLTSGQKYWFRVAAVGASGQGPWSDPAVRVAP